MQAEGGKGGGRTDSVNSGRHRHVEQDAETSDRGWRVAGVVNGQVDDAPRREMRWRAGVKIGVTKRNG